MNRFFCVSAFSIIAAGCAETSDPASEAPVELEPGRYEITMSGAGLLKAAGNDNNSRSTCLRAGERAMFPHKLAENYYRMHYSCSNKRLPREGNAVGGEISCAADPKLATGANRFVYNGAVAADNVRLEVKMKLDALIKEDEMTEAQIRELKLGMKMMEHARFVIEAKRTGDC
ncbi:MAG: hypothetical protein DHS20C05_16900 [Hyphococcus sp.]|nr:MAG: hypothetical protein DHS20C05_16900 [Marinicaulis sp.]